jgi:hypothetical protein
MKLVALLLLLTTSGCFGTTRLYYSQASMATPHTIVVKSVTHNWLWGLVDGDAVVMGAACGQNGVAAIDVQHGIVDWLLFGVTFGLYARSTVVFTCE